MDIIMLLAVIAVTTITVVLIKKSNPDGGRKITYYSTKDLARKETCARCGCRMKKEWEKEEMDLMGFSSDKHREYNGIPIFTCPKCGYQIKG